MVLMYFHALRNRPGSLYNLFKRKSQKQDRNNNEEKKMMNKSRGSGYSDDYDVILKGFRCLLLDTNCDSDIYSTRKPKNLLFYDKKLQPVNGLICYIDLRVFAVCIYNLCTLEVVTTWIKSNLFTKEKGEHDGVQLVHQVPTYGFGYDPDTKEYKVICVWRRKFRVQTPSRHNGSIVCDVVCEILTVGQNSWRRIHEVPQYDLEGASIYANGSIYWRNFKILNDELDDDHPEVIVAFDVGSEKFRVIPIPDFILDYPRDCGEYIDPFISLLEIDGRLALLQETKIMNGYSVKLWIFDDDLKENMTAAATTSTSNGNWIEETITLPFCSGRYQLLYFHPVAGTDKIIVEAYGGYFTDIKFAHLYSYNRKKKTFKKVGTGGNSLLDLCRSSFFTSLMESFLPVQKRQKKQQLAAASSCPAII